ncbi:MAG: hypothetical protein AAFM92_15015 [Pseudomonadota bacterium]
MPASALHRAWRVAWLCAGIGLALCAGLAILLFTVAQDDLAFRGADSLGAPDARFAMVFYGAVALLCAALSVLAFWTGRTL